MLEVGVIGGTGYTGAELVRLLLSHPEVCLRAVSSRRLEGQPLSASHPWLGGQTELSFVSQEAIVADAKIGLVFTALGHTESAPVVDLLLGAGKRVVDLSADFRLRDPDLYRQWYGVDHPVPGLLAQAVYGLPERYRGRILEASLVANPGCFATAAILGLLPLAKAGLLPPGGAVIDAKSGVSGAGRTPRDNTVFPECNEGLRPYAVTGHRHRPEMETVLGEAAGANVPLLFVPHLIPVNRGILATIYVECAEPLQKVRQACEDYYWREPFVKVSPPGRVPGIQDVRGSNLCRLGVEQVPGDGRVMVFSVIDNLVKGAAGQAVQNMNIMLGLPEESGLKQLAIFP